MEVGSGSVVMALPAVPTDLVHVWTSSHRLLVSPYHFNPGHYDFYKHGDFVWVATSTEGLKKMEDRISSH